METRSLGHTSLLVTPLGLGLAALGRPGYITLGHDEDVGPVRDGAALEARSHEVLDAAWAAGVRYVDAARSYGKAEDFLASWLAARRVTPGELTVGSKWGYVYTANWRVDAEKHEVKDHSAANLRRQLAETRARIGAYLRLYQVHSATFESGVLEDADVLGALVRLREEGVEVGLTLSGPRQADVLRRALEVRADGRPVFGCVQATFNLLERSVGPALAEARAAGWGVLLKEGVANGRLTGRNHAPEVEALHTVANAHGVSPDALALAWVLSHPWVDTALSGAATVAQLRSNLSALTVPQDAVTDPRLLGMAQTPQAYWSVRAALPWR
ncbi:MAG: aldo/keto reductase [Myxococcaceae bacterium]|nr:aldo/keto reductase [Myxococcaceae bacterium]MCI0673943.1 aldo/keto reductase [Myxococcaceae bacterium]